MLEQRLPSSQISQISSGHFILDTDTFSILPSKDNNDHLFLPLFYEREGIVSLKSKQCIALK